MASLPTTYHLPPTASPGFTLLELLAVFIIITVLAGAIFGVSKIAATNAATSRTKAEIAAMEAALESYKNDNGAYPQSTAIRNSPPPGNWGTIEIQNSTNLYSALVGPSKQYFKFKPEQLRQDPTTGNYYVIDPFGSPYNYYCNPNPSITRTNQATFDLWSYGPDHLNDTADDIVNWRR